MHTCTQTRHEPTTIGSTNTDANKNTLKTTKGYNGSNNNELMESEVFVAINCVGSLNISVFIRVNFNKDHK